MLKVLIAESLQMETLREIAQAEGLVLHEKGKGEAKQDAIHLYYQPDISPEGLEKIAAERIYDALILRPKQINAKVISNAVPKLKLIVRGGTGVNSIDLKAAKKHGVVVENTPGQNSISTAEFTFALMMEVLARRQIYRSDKDTRAHKAGIPEDYQGREMAGKTLAIVGLGSIGLEVAKRAAAFDMRVIGYSRTQKDVPYQHYKTIDALLDAQADVVSLHIPLTPENNGIINDAAFARMKQGTVLVNCARPQLVDPAAFKKALASGILSSFAIDGDPDLVEPFIKADPKAKGLITHHIADATFEAQANITRQALMQLLVFFREGKVVNGVV